MGLRVIESLEFLERLDGSLNQLSTIILVLAVAVLMC